MGVVYAARSRAGARVALKVIRADLRDDPTFRTRFEREASIAQRVAGRCTARVVAAGLSQRLPYFATEYVAGPTLSEYVGATGALLTDDVVALAAGLAEGLAAIHALGVVHRDLTPRNVILSTDGPKIIDFGIARREDATTLTGAQGLIGTPMWMAPEQVLGEPVTAASDVFVWGALVVFAATGQVPFAAERPEAAAYRTVHGDANLTGVPEALVPLVARALQRDPALRPTAIEWSWNCRPTTARETSGSHQHEGNPVHHSRLR